MGRARPPRCPDAAGAAMRTPEYTLDEAAEVLMVPKRTLQHLVATKQIGHFRSTNRRTLFAQAHLDTWLRQHEVLPDELAVDLPARRPARTTARTGAATVTTLRRKPADWRSRRTA